MSATDEIASLQIDLERTFSRVAAAAGQPPPGEIDLELQSDLAKYLCILTCGFLEEAIERLLTEYCQLVGDARISRYMESEIKRLRNPERKEILEITGRLDHSWKERMQQMLTNTEYGDALTGVFAVRHAVVHGSTATTTLTDARGYFDRIRLIVRFMASLILPMSTMSG